MVAMKAKAAAEMKRRGGVEEEGEDGAGVGENGMMRKGPWTEQEDVQLVWFVRLFGERRWDFLAKVSGLKRTGKSCRLRWVNYLHPGLKRGRITADEERLILQLHAQWGSRWSRIARSLPGRTDNEIKNYWRTHVRKKAQEDKKKRAAAASTSSTSPSPSPASSSCSSSSSSSSLNQKGTTTSASASSAVTESPVQESSSTGGGGDEATTAASQHHQQQEHGYYYSMDQLWSDIAAAESYAEAGWGGAGHVAAAADHDPAPSPVWEFAADYSLWKIDDEEYYKKMLDAS